MQRKELTHDLIFAVFLADVELAVCILNPCIGRLLRCTKEATVCEN